MLVCLIVPHVSLSSHFLHSLFFLLFSLHQFSSVAQSCPTLCDSMECSTPGLPVHCKLPELLKLISIESVMPSSLLILCCPLLLPPSIFPSIGVFFNESVLCIRWPNIGVSASASVLSVNIQSWFPLGLTGFQVIVTSNGHKRETFLQTSSG